MLNFCPSLIRLASSSSFLLTTWTNMERVIMLYFCIAHPKDSTISSFIKLWRNGFIIMSKIWNRTFMLSKMEVLLAFMIWRSFWKSSRRCKMVHSPFKMGSRSVLRASLSFCKALSIQDATIYQVNTSSW